MIVRYADDFVMGFEKKADAEEMLLALKARLASFGLTLHEEKTRLIEFGRFAALSRQRRSEQRPETFAFLGFTHYCGWTRDGRFIVKHKTEGKRLTRKLTALRREAWRLMHAPLAAQHRWFFEANWVTRALFVVDRNTLAIQAEDAFVEGRGRVAQPFGFRPHRSGRADFPHPALPEGNPRHIRACAQVRVMRGVGRGKRTVRVANSDQPMRRLFWLRRLRHRSHIRRTCRWNPLSVG